MLCLLPASFVELNFMFILIDWQNFRSLTLSEQTVGRDMGRLCRGVSFP